MTRARALAAGCLAAVVLLVTAAPASAHAELVSTRPAAGARLSSAPRTASVTFNEVVTTRPDGVRVYDSRGNRVETHPLSRADGGRTLRVGLPGHLADGGYVLAWRVISADGHPVGAAVTFRVGSGGNDVSSGLLADLLNAAQGDALVAGAAAVGRGLLYAGLLLLIGGYAFLVLVAPELAGDERARWLRRGGWAMAVVGTVAGLCLEAADLAGLGLSAAVRPSVVADVLSTDYGRAALVRLALLAAVGVVLWRGLPATAGRARAAAAAVAVALVATVTLAGHARTGRWVALAVPLDVAHVLAGALWLGGLVTLVTVGMRRERAADGSAFAIARRFSDLALPLVAVIVATGTLQAFRQLDGLHSLSDTNYGRLLVVKVVVVALLVAVAGLSRSLLRARGIESVAQLRQTVGAEVVIGIVVIGVTSLLVAADPGRATANTAYSTSKLVGTTAMQLVVAPNRTGPVDIHLYLSDPSAGLVKAQEATGTMSLPAKGITGLRVPFVFAGADHFSANDLDVPIRGRWVLTVRVRLSALEERATTFEIPIN